VNFYKSDKKCVPHKHEFSAQLFNPVLYNAKRTFNQQYNFFHSLFFVFGRMIKTVTATLLEESSLKRWGCSFSRAFLTPLLATPKNIPLGKTHSAEM